MNNNKKSAADIEALRWRELFQQTLHAHIINNPADDYNPGRIVNEAAILADIALGQFYQRYEREK